MSSRRAAIALSLAFGLLAQTASAAASSQGMKPAPLISWRDAAQHIGQYRCVEGQVRRTSNTGTICFLNFGGRQQFVVVIFARSFRLFPQPPEQLYRHKRVRVWGIVEDYKGKPEIVVEHPRQIEAQGVTLPKPPAAARIRIATYNVHNLFDGYDDPYTADQTKSGRPLAASPAQIRALCAVIKALDADMLALQEVENRGFLRQIVNKRLRDLRYRHVVLVEGNDGRGIDVAVLSRFPVGKVTSFRHLTFDDAIGVPRSFARDALRVEVLPRPGSKLIVYALHLKSRLGGRRAQLWRNAEAKQLRTLLDAERGRVVVLGDFNDDLESDTLKTLLGAGGPFPLTPAAALGPDGSDATCRSNGYPPIRFDYVLLSPCLAAGQVPDSAKIVASADARAASDHRPVVVEVELQQ